jgi:hypothetical protein
MVKYTLTCRASSVANTYHSGYLVNLPEEMVATLIDLVKTTTKLPDGLKHSIFTYQITVTKDEHPTD